MKVLVAKPGLDGHDRGAKVMASALRDSGVDVLYTGLRQTPETIVKTAVQEDVDMICLSILSGAHMHLTKRVLDLLKEKNANIPVIVGGIVPDEDVMKLKEMGIKHVFTSGTSMKEAVSAIKNERA